MPSSFALRIGRRRARSLSRTGVPFDNLLAKPDAEYEIAFRLFDEDGTGTIKYERLPQALHVEQVTGNHSV